jgi:Cu/Ag efflux protein CusF
MKISNLPKTSTSAKNDAIAIVQGGVTKSISKEDLLRSLSSLVSNLQAEIRSLKSNVSKNTISKDTPVFNTAIVAPAPSSGRHLTNKDYVDNQLFNTVKNDGTTKLLQALSFLKSPEDLDDLDLVPKEYVDEELKNFIGTPQAYNENSYPYTERAGECFIFTADNSNFAEGPEIQTGDILISLSASSGGTHGEVGNQFAIINTNVILATEETAGIVKIATIDELTDLTANQSVLTPLNYKNTLEDSSDYKRTVFATPIVALTEENKGIVSVDTRRNSVTVTLPSIASLEHPKLTKFTIKDEYLNALQNIILINCSGGDTIQNSQRYTVNANGGSVTFYNDGTNQWFVESNVFSGSELTSGVRTLLTDDITNGENATSTGAYTSIFSIDVDLRDYAVGTGFKVVAHSLAIANGNTKTTAIGIDGQQVLPSSLTTVTAPNNKYIHQEATVMHSSTAQYFAYGFAYVGTSVAAGLTNSLNLDWNSTITVSFDVNVSAVADISAYSLQVIPLK